VLALLSAGNLATTQSVVTLLTQRLGADGRADDLWSAVTMFDAARMVGAVLREILHYDGEHVRAHGDPGAGFLLAGQIRGGPHRLFQIYTAGNFIEATPETPYLQIGETKYGKPILDRVISYGSGLAEATKCILLSFDATMRSNLSVAPPIDLLCYPKDSLRANLRIDISDADPYFASLRDQFGQGMLDLFARLPNPDWVESTSAARTGSLTA
jgi:putative proteasome-type protease